MASTAGRLMTAGTTTRRGTLWQRIWAARWCYLFMLPSLILAAMFTFYPIVASWYISFLDWSGFTAARQWVGLENYREVIGDQYFWAAFRRSFVFMGVSLPIRLGLALGLAILLNDQALKLSPVFRTFFFIPVVTTAAIVGIVMTFVFSPFNGPVNKFLLGSGLADRPVDFLGTPDTALWTVLAVFIWKNLGITMIYWLAALQTIPAELYEAAKVDGATGWASFRRITLPLLAPFTIIITLITAVQTLHVFPIVQAMTGGGPFFSSEVIEVYIYRTAFGEGGIPRLGYASAAAVFFGLATLVIAIIQGVGLRRANAARRELNLG
ncbi:MAG: sugar ABC transporter permease [Chloroflexota bacterium]|nr:sugar ABC transporter permease [Chloroflexota bacterium]